jgi:hypothetical protein
VVHRADAWAADWAISAVELRALRQAVYDLLNKSKPAGKEAFAALVAYLALFEVRQGAACGAAVQPHTQPLPRRCAHAPLAGAQTLRVR